MGNPDLIVDGRRLSMYMPWGDLELVKCWPGGTESITFDVARGHALFRPGALVEVDYGGVCIGAATLQRQKRGEPLQARGLYRLGEERSALTMAGAPTLNVQVAIERAIAQTALPWVLTESIGPQPGVTDVVELDPNTPHTITDLLEVSATRRGGNWGINPRDRSVTIRPWGATPDAHLLPDVDGLGRNAEDYASRLIARYHDSTTDLYETAVQEDSEATKRWGYRERMLPELLAEGRRISAAEADAILVGMLAQGRRKIGWERPIEVRYGDVRNDRQQAVDLWNLGQPAQTLAAHGLVDDAPDLDGGTSALIRVARTRHKGDTVLIEPAGLSTPFADALASNLNGAR